jgi:ribokinase
MLDVISIGNINIDLSFYVDKIPEIDYEVLANLEIFHGGGAANFAVAASRLGLKVGIIGCVGNDYFGKKAIEELEKEGVITNFIKVVNEKLTGMVCVIVEKNGNRRMLAYRGANEYLEKTISEVIDKIPYCKYIQLCNVNKKVFMEVKEKIKKTKISLDPGGRVIEFSLNDLEGIDLLLLNEVECKKLTNVNYKEGAKLLSKYVNIVVVKMGERGAYLFDGNNEIEIPAIKVNVVDTTGAGDAFNAGFITGLIRGLSLRECMYWGIATAALKIQKKGARSGLPNINELKKFLSYYQNPTSSIFSIF